MYWVPLRLCWKTWAMSKRFLAGSRTLVFLSLWSEHVWNAETQPHLVTLHTMKLYSSFLVLLEMTVNIGDLRCWLVVCWGYVPNLLLFLFYGSLAFIKIHGSFASQVNDWVYHPSSFVCELCGTARLPQYWYPSKWRKTHSFCHIDFIHSSPLGRGLFCIIWLKEIKCGKTLIEPQLLCTKDGELLRCCSS